MRNMRKLCSAILMMMATATFDTDLTTFQNQTYLA